MTRKPYQDFESCDCCGQRAKYSILVAGPHQEDRLYLPNKECRESKDFHQTRELYMCHPCMRFVEDNFRACVAYLKSEKGIKFIKFQE